MLSKLKQAKLLQKHYLQGKAAESDNLHTKYIKCNLHFKATCMLTLIL